MPTIKNIKLICFDLDGTLVDSVPDLTLALNAMLNEFNLAPCQDTDVKNWVGNGIPKMVERALHHVGIHDVEQAYFAQVVASFEKHYEHYLNTASGLYPKVAQTLQQLHNKGYKTALITNKAEQFLPELLKFFAIAEHFDLLLGGDSLAKNKPNPLQVDFACEHFSVSKSETIMIGDSRNDILAGQNANVKTIALTYGYNYGEPVSLLNPDYIINEFNELLDLL